MNLPARIIRRMRPVSRDYRVVQHAPERQPPGWLEDRVARRQHASFAALLAQLRTGIVRRDFAVAAEAIRATNLADPLVVEVGCGSGYYAEALRTLLGRRLRYIGLDLSPAMITVGRQSFPGVPFVIADAVRIPLRDHSCDIVFNGTALMHIPNYRAVLEESRRVSKAWCILHTVPVLTRRQTTLLTKRAYGAEVVEVIFNQGELETVIGALGMHLVQRIESLEYDLRAVLGESTRTYTYVLRAA